MGVSTSTLSERENLGVKLQSQSTQLQIAAVAWQIETRNYSTFSQITMDFLLTVAIVNCIFNVHMKNINTNLKQYAAAAAAAAALLLLLLLLLLL